VHEVFHASGASTEYAYFNKDDGIGFGSPMQKLKNHCSQSYLNLGLVSLTFGHSLEYGIFQNTGGGGAYNSTGDEDYYTRDVFEIEEIEVWGCGGDSEAETEGSGVGGTGSAGAQADYAWEGSWGGQGFGGWVFLSLLAGSFTNFLPLCRRC